MFQINHDLHAHTFLSSCCHDAAMTPHLLLDRARERGFDTICVTDHLWDSTVRGASNWYQPQNIAHVQSSLPLPKGGGIRFCFGCETEFLGGQHLGLAASHFSMFDFVVIPLNHMHMKGFVRPMEVNTPEAIAELFTCRAEEALMLPIPFEKVGFAHLNASCLLAKTGAAAVLRLCDRTRWKRIFRMMAQKGAGVELNASAFAAAWEDDWDAHIAFFLLARDMGCRFYCASDAHKTSKLDMSSLTDAVNALQLTEDMRYVIP